jgi:predicted membrane channel-forming protein YqfA (hemolysin III family)
MSGPTLLLLALGRAVYSAGALVYASGRPNPAPAVFGYHEVFHTLAIVAAGMHFAAVASVVLPTLWIAAVGTSQAFHQTSTRRKSGFTVE